MNNFIEDINPLVISKIFVYCGHRYGAHPSMLKYMKKKHPIKAFFGFYEPADWYSYRKPCVKIYGSDGACIKIVTCRSNDHARDVKNSLENKLNEFLSSLKVKT
jgi:hypothetical protein